MNIDIKQLLNLQMARLNSRWAQERIARQKQDKRVKTGVVLGIDSALSINGNPCVLIKNSDGTTMRAASISSGLQPGQRVNIATPKNSKYGIVTSMPAGRI